MHNVYKAKRLKKKEKENTKTAILLAPQPINEIK